VSAATHSGERRACDDHVMAVRVVIVDDHPPFRALARKLLEMDGFQVVGESGDAAGAVDVATTTAPDLVLLDIGLPDADGFEVARLLSTLERPPMVVLISSRDSTAYRKRLAASGVRGFLPKAELSGAALAAMIG